MNTGAFLSGMLATLAALAWFLAAPPRQRRAARFLNALADGLEAQAAPQRRQKNSPQETAPVDSREKELFDGLMHLKCPKARAAQAAKQALAQWPAAGFNDQFKAAVGFARVQ